MIYIIVGPSGTGKSSICKVLLDRNPSNLTRVVTATTRAPRPGEVHGREYFFYSKEEFSQTETFAVTDVDGESYGIPVGQFKEAAVGDRDLIVVLDIPGAREIKTIFKDDAKVIFVYSEFVVRKARLIQRGDSPASIDARLKLAVVEMRTIMDDPSFISGVVVNNNGHLQSAVDTITTILNK